MAVMMVTPIFKKNLTFYKTDENVRLEDYAPGLRIVRTIIGLLQPSIIKLTISFINYTFTKSQIDAFFYFSSDFSVTENIITRT